MFLKCRQIILKSVILILLLPIFLFAQPISSDTWVVRNLSIMQDLGYGWDVQSTFKPFRMENLIQSNIIKEQKSLNWLSRDFIKYITHTKKTIENSENQITGTTWVGFLGQLPYGNEKPFEKNVTSLYMINQVWFKKHFSVEWYFRASSDTSGLEHFTADPQPVRRLGINSGEFDQATLSYYNNWMTLQFGRGRQVWGTDMKENLLLSSGSASYDHLFAEAKYKNWSGVYFSGFLESIENNGNNFNRYIFGHGLQYNNRRNLLISFYELVTYYGINRPLDITYLNPVIPHFEVEMNKRENDLSSNHSNGYWGVSLDWLIWKRVRLSTSYLADQIHINGNNNLGSKYIDASAFQFRLGKSFIINKNTLTLYGKYIRVGTFAYRHSTPYTVLVSRNLPLGLPDGSDFYSCDFGLINVTPYRFIFRFNYEYRKQGENNLIVNKYIPYKNTVRKGKFPSGVVTEYQTAEISLLYSFKENIDLEMILHYQSVTINEMEKTGNYFLLRFNYNFPFGFSL